MSRLVRVWWDRFWFEPEPALHLAVARMLASATALWILLSRDRAGVSGLGPEFWAGIATSTRWRFLLFPGHESLERLLTTLAALLLVCAFVGIWPRVSAFAAALLLYHLAPLESLIWSASPTSRGLTLPTLTLLVCGIAPSGDALARGAVPTTPSWRYAWPLRLVQVWLVSVYFLSGLSKLRTTGLSWGSAENLSHWLRQLTQNELIGVHTVLGEWIAARPPLAGALGVTTLAFELGSVAALASRRVRPWFAFVAIAFHAGIYVTINITFNSWPLLLVFVDWKALTARVRRGRALAA